MKKIMAADLFCGAGGTSTGLAYACMDLGLKVELVAINHWPIAVATHTQNHPWARHLCADLASVDPVETVPGGHLHILVASPECQHHSVARGGRPRQNQSRASAWHVLHWAERLRIDNILVENVREFETWGPLDDHGKPLKSRKGETFKAFIKALESLGFNVDFRVLNAADYGDATIRRRIFVQARRGADPVWPEASHSGHWRPAREIIDWGLKGQSIFGRKRPLANRTLARIEAGLRKFGGEAFLTILRGTGGVRTVDAPTPAITAGGKHLGLCQPFIVKFDDHRNDDHLCATSIESPISTITSKAGHALCEPFMVNMKGKSNAASVDAPTPAITTREHLALCEPFILPHRHGGYFKDRPRSPDEPLPALTACSSDIGLVQPFIVTVNHGEDKKTGGPESRVHSVDEPLGTITTCKSQALCEPFLVDTNHGGDESHGSPESRTHPVGEPLDAITTRNGKALIEPFLMKYYGTGICKPVDEPLDTIRTKECFGLVEPQADGCRLDIRFRMLQPHELAAAMSLEKYKFTGTKEQMVKQIGNAVPARMAKALCKSMLRNIHA
jgi:DNA (cytosine-5)-methyltransferase 1